MLSKVLLHNLITNGHANAKSRSFLAVWYSLENNRAEHAIINPMDRVRCIAEIPAIRVRLWLRGAKFDILPTAREPLPHTLWSARTPITISTSRDAVQYPCRKVWHRLFMIRHPLINKFLFSPVSKLLVESYPGN